MSFRKYHIYLAIQIPYGRRFFVEASSLPRELVENGFLTQDLKIVFLDKHFAMLQDPTGIPKISKTKITSSDLD